MWRKLRIYLFGVVLGLILTWALVLRNRNADEFLKWTPGNRVLSEIKNDSSLVYPDDFSCTLDCHNLSSLDWENLLEEGSVNFQESSTRSKPKIYRVEYEDEDRLIKADFSVTEDRQELLMIQTDEDLKCNCNDL